MLSAFKRRRRAEIVKFLCCAACAAFLTITCVLVLHSQTNTVYLRERRTDSGAPAGDSATGPRVNITAVDEFRYLPASARDAMGEREFLVIFGIPSVDDDGRRRRRDLQRTTCWRYPGVATKANNFTGAMLVLYVLARHPSHNYEYSAALIEEAARWGDIVALPLNEGRVTTKKQIGGGGFWGNEAEIGMSRKTYLWFELALRVFPTAQYVAKGDDDMFLRVPQYLADMRALPQRSVYWGTIMSVTLDAYNQSNKFFFCGGPCYTLGRNAAKQVVLFEPLKRLVHLPYSKERESGFLALKMHHEDMMVGCVLNESKGIDALGLPILYVREKWCAFHNVDVTYRLKAVSEGSIMVHHVQEHEYEELMARFGNDTGGRARRLEHINENNAQFPCMS